MKEKLLAEAIGDGVNALAFSPKLFCDAMSRQHRTLQQSFTRICFAWINHLAGLKENEYDGRNEASVLACQKVKGRCLTDDFYLPLI